LLNPSPARLVRFRNHYLNGILQADEVIRLVWKWLEESGYLKDAILVITSDHGESMGEHGRIGHGKSLRHPELNIPLWIYDSRQAVRLPDVVRQVDIAPLILSRLSLPVPRTWAGRPVDVGSSAEWSEHLYPVDPSSVAVIRSRPGQVLKYLREADAEYVFDLLTDAGERLNMIGQLSLQEEADFRSRADSLQSAIQRGRVAQ
jgi:arylsulfatase A-like enzyme